MKSFKDYLSNVEYPKEKDSWDIAGTLKNGFYKFDTKPIKKTKNGEVGKYSSFKTKADKMVFEADSHFVIVDIDELHNYLKENKVKKVYLQDLISKLEWNIILPKI